MNPHCLICHNPIQPIMTWTTLLSPEKKPLLCHNCEEKFEMIHGETCKICCRPLTETTFHSNNICHDCLRWENDPHWQGYLDQNISIFTYNEFLKEVIAKYKFRGDYVLAKVFVEHIKQKLNEAKVDLFVPIPLSDERLYQRGFNQAEALLAESGFCPTHLLTRIHTEKQSKKTRSERIHLAQVFKISDEINVKGKKILIVDDIYTTGSTLRHAAKLLKEAGALYIQSLTLAR